MPAMHKAAAFLFVAVALMACEEKPASAPQEPCAHAVDHGIELFKATLTSAEVASTKAELCKMAPREALECQLAATDMPALIECYKLAAVATISIDGKGPDADKQKLCDRADAHAQKLMFDSVAAARQPRIDACLAAKAVHAPCQIAATSPQAWMQCDPSSPPLGQ